MRWSCPHCGINLAVSDDKITTGWSFSRCYKCGGFALIRRSDINLIKVDKAPAGENVILPEASEDPTTGLSDRAAQKLSQYVAGPAGAGASKPVIRPATRRSQTSAGIAPTAAAAGITQTIQTHRPGAATSPIAALGAGIASQSRANAAAHAAATGIGATAAGQASFIAQGSALGLPEPLPEEPPRPLYHRFLPFAIGAAGVLAIGSGVYLYIQGQALWEKARASAVRPVNADARATATAAAPASPAQPAPALAAARQTDSREVIDQVHQNAMAPARATEPAAEPAPQAVNPQPESDVNRSPAVLPAIAADKPGSAAANIPAARLVTSTATGMLVKSKIRAANLHSGPGMQYPVVGVASPELRYSVSEWNDRWFRIVVQDPKGTQKLAWIRNDLVQLVTH